MEIQGAAQLLGLSPAHSIACGHKGPAAPLIQCSALRMCHGHRDGAGTAPRSQGITLLGACTTISCAHCHIRQDESEATVFRWCWLGRIRLQHVCEALWSLAPYWCVVGHAPAAGTQGLWCQPEAPLLLTCAIPPTIFSFTTTVSSWSWKAAAFCAAFTRLSDALFTALPAACGREGGISTLSHSPRVALLPGGVKSPCPRLGWQEDRRAGSRRQ